jgi:ATP-dependent HslUV protease, peptidase subunit HslV
LFYKEGDMPTVVAVKKGNSICIGSDQLAIDRGKKNVSKDVLNAERIVEIEKNVYIGAVDHAAWPLILRRYFHRSKKKHNFSAPEDIFEELLRLHPILKEHYFIYPNPDEGAPFECSQFEAIIIHRDGLFRTSWLRAVQAYARFCAVGSGAPYALGAMEAIYDEVNDAKEIVRRALQIASEYDINTNALGSIFSISSSSRAKKGAL